MNTNQGEAGGKSKEIILRELGISTQVKTETWKLINLAMQAYADQEVDKEKKHFETLYIDKHKEKSGAKSTPHQVGNTTQGDTKDISITNQETRIVMNAKRQFIESRFMGFEQSEELYNILEKELNEAIEKDGWISVETMLKDWENAEKVYDQSKLPEKDSQPSSEDKKYPSVNTSTSENVKAIGIKHSKEFEKILDSYSQPEDKPASDPLGHRWIPYEKDGRKPVVKIGKYYKYPGDLYYWVSPGWKIESHEVYEGMEAVGRFESEEIAQKWIDENKPSIPKEQEGSSLESKVKLIIDAINKLRWCHYWENLPEQLRDNLGKAIEGVKECPTSIQSTEEGEDKPEERTKEEIGFSKLAMLSFGSECYNHGYDFKDNRDKLFDKFIAKNKNNPHLYASQEVKKALKEQTELRWSDEDMKQAYLQGIKSTRVNWGMSGEFKTWLKEYKSKTGNNQINQM